MYIQSHWHTICLDFKLKIIYVGNGNTSFGDITDELLFTLLYDIIYVFNLESIDKSMILELIDQWKIIRPVFILQDDSCSCGPIAIIFAILFAFDIEIETTLKQQLVITNDMMTNIRIKIASSLLSQRSFFALDYLLGINTNLSKTIEQIILKTKDSVRVRNISDNDIQKKERKNENGSFRKNNKGLITTKNNLSNIYYILIFQETLVHLIILVKITKIFLNQAINLIKEKHMIMSMILGKVKLKLRILVTKTKV